MFVGTTNGHPDCISNANAPGPVGIFAFWPDAEGKKPWIGPRMPADDARVSEADSSYFPGFAGRRGTVRPRTARWN